MARKVNGKIETRFPTRGVPGGYRDWWDGPPEYEVIRARLAAWETACRRVAEEWRREVEARHHPAARAGHSPSTR